jgi:hypothetical protein
MGVELVETEFFNETGGRVIDVFQQSMDMEVSRVGRCRTITSGVGGKDDGRRGA